MEQVMELHQTLSALIPLGFSCEPVSARDDCSNIRLVLMDKKRSTLHIRFRTSEDGSGQTAPRELLPVLLENLSYYASARQDSTLAKFTQLWLAWYSHAIAEPHRRDDIAREARRIGEREELPADWLACLDDICAGKNPFN